MRDGTISWLNKSGAAFCLIVRQVTLRHWPSGAAGARPLNRSQGPALAPHPRPHTAMTCPHLQHPLEREGGREAGRQAGREGGRQAGRDSGNQKIHQHVAGPSPLKHHLLRCRRHGSRAQPACAAAELNLRYYIWSFTMPRKKASYGRSQKSERRRAAPLPKEDNSKCGHLEEHQNSGGNKWWHSRCPGPCASATQHLGSAPPGRELQGEVQTQP